MTISRTKLSALPVACLAGLILLLLAGCGPGAPPEEGDGGATGPLAYDFSLTDLAGKTHRLSDYRGKVVLLDFWDTWCPPCKEEIPGFVELQRRFGDRGLQVIGVALGREGREKVTSFVSAYRIQYPTLLATQTVVEGYGGLRAIPTTLLIDREGRIRETMVGYHPPEHFEQKVIALF